MTPAPAEGTWAVLAPNWLGDAVMCLPALAEWRRQRPQQPLRLYARPGVAPVFAAAGLGLDVRVTPRPRGTGLAALRELRRQADAAPEAALLLPNSVHAALAARALGARRIVGYARQGRRLLLTQAIARPRRGEIPEHESFYYLELLRRAGLIAALPAAPAAHLRAEPGLVAAWRARLPQLAGPRVAIHAGASHDLAKRWLPERFAATAAALAAGGAQVVLIGGGDERALAARVRARAVADGAPEARVVDLAGETSLAELLALLTLCDLLIANDSGPMHLAAALGTPVVAIFGPTRECATRPLAAPGRLRIVRAEGVACSPCKLARCPIDHRCMTRIAAAEVIAAAEAFLARSGGPAAPAGG
ncbi:MAG TPA: lipopolysaccharide heptosyltransferase II [Terriglobales bacterium]|nr:lipopolysaccharide heptosyltransferase II [Terriglobales bacterium]